MKEPILLAPVRSRRRGRHFLLRFTYSAAERKCIQKPMNGYGVYDKDSFPAKDHTPPRLCINCKNGSCRGIFLKEYIEERAVEIATYIIEHDATVRQTARAFGVSKSTVHTAVTKQNGSGGWRDRDCYL